MSQLRPISFCNVSYKVLTKIVVNRLKPFISKIISPFQTDFVPTRSIHDNIIVAQEMVHSMTKMKGKKGFFAIKVDLAKAYDRLRWDFFSCCAFGGWAPPCSDSFHYALYYLCEL